MLGAVMLLAETLDLRDGGTSRHSQTVGVYARETAVALGLAPDHVQRVHAAGVLHDLGKLGIAHATLFKPGPLDEAEWRDMKRHPEIGARILEHAGLSDIFMDSRHHERIDGRGYPLGLPGETIALEAHPRGRRCLRGDDRRLVLPLRDAHRRCLRRAAPLFRQPV